MYVGCPKCSRIIKIDLSDGCYEFHHPSPKVTFSPKHHCEVSGSNYIIPCDINLVTCPNSGCRRSSVMITKKSKIHQHVDFNDEPCKYSGSVVSASS